MEMYFADASAPRIPEFKGSAAIEVLNYPAVENNPLVISSGDAYQTEDPNAGVINAHFPVYGDKSSIVLSGYREDGELVYKKIADVTPGQSIAEDFSTFTPYPTTIEVPNNKDVAYMLAGYNEDWERRGTTFSYHEWYSSSPTPAIMGYLPGYKGYYTSVDWTSAENSRISVSYSKRGEVPTTTEMELPSFYYSILDESVKSPRFFIDKNYTIMQSYWSYGSLGSTQVSCNMFTPKNFRLKLTSLPAEILSKYPEVTLDKLVFGDCFVTEYLDGSTYEEAINDHLTFNSRRDTYEYRLYRFAP